MSKTQSERLAEPPGKVIVARALLAGSERPEAGAGRPGARMDVRSTPRCRRTCGRSRAIWLSRFELRETTTNVEAGLTIPGQVYDWGKSQRALQQLFDDLTQLSKAA